MGMSSKYNLQYFDKNRKTIPESNKSSSRTEEEKYGIAFVRSQEWGGGSKFF